LGDLPEIVEGVGARRAPFRERRELGGRDLFPDFGIATLRASTESFQESPAGSLASLRRSEESAQPHIVRALVGRAEHGLGLRGQRLHTFPVLVLLKTMSS
jgi:hypothetical protein